MKDGKYFCLGCDTCGEATNINYKLQSIIDKEKLNYKIALITSETKIKYNDIEDPEHTFIIYSPSVNTGVDINLTSKTTQYMHIKGVSVNSISLYQMATRTRNQKELIYFSKVNEKEVKYENLSECRTHFKDINNMNEELLNVSSAMSEDTDELKALENTFFKLYTYNEYVNDTLNSNTTLHFENILTDAGFNIIKEAKTPVKNLDRATSKDMNDNLKECKNDEFKKNIDNFDNLSSDNSFKKKCEFLGILNKETAVKYKFVLEDEYKLNSYFNIQKLFKTDKYLNDKAIDNKTNNFNVKTSKDTITKIKLLRVFEKKMKIDKLDIHMEQLNIEKVDKLSNDEIKHFQNVFRSTKTKLDNKIDIQKFYIGLIKNITGELNILQSKKTTTKANKTTYINSFNDELIKNIFELTLLKDAYLLNYNDEILNKLSIKKPDKANNINDDDIDKEYSF